MNAIIISGPSATGKSVLGRRYAANLGYDFIGKDEIKEKLFDTESHNSWDWMWYERMAKNKFFDDVAKALNAGRSVVVESNFIKSDRLKLKNKLADADDIREIYVTANGMTRVRRFIQRNESGHRHRKHHDRRWYLSEFIDGVAGIFGIRLRYRPMSLSRKLLIVDTTDFLKIDYDIIDKFLK